MAQVPFIRYGGNFFLRQPYLIQRSTGYGFAVEGDYDKMQALIDRTLNLPGSDMRYRLLTSTVLITFMRMAHMVSEDPADAHKGSYHETELNFTVLLAAEKKIGPVYVPERIVWHMPYLWVDSGPVMIAGREVYGYPKQFGSIAFPKSSGARAEFAAAGEVLQTFAPTTQSAVAPIVRAHRTDQTFLELEAPFEVLEHALPAFLTQVLRMPHPLVFAGSVLAELTVEHLLALVFLRQLPSIEDGSQACYQSIAEMPFDIAAFRSAGFLSGQYEVEIFRHESVPIAEELGFAATDAAGNARLQPWISYFVDLDFRLGNGREVWVAP